VSRDDIIDAAVMLLTAMRIEEGRPRRLPVDIEERNERGLLMEMWA
jgi:predicted RNase H-like nuclease